MASSWGAIFWSLAACILMAQADKSLPNILFILTDDMGWGDVSYNKEMYQPGAGGKKWTVNPPRTPNIDAIATGGNTMLFRRWYTGSAVCSPTRASIMSGRTPQRSCINSAEGCGQSPAWNCYDKMPFPPTEFTVGAALKQKKYSTLFVGKWHLGDFWDKGESAKGNFALSKWPASHPGMHGYDEWAATEASASSSTTNCGCVASWKDTGKGCIVGGGSFQKKALKCTNYWSPTDLDSKHVPSRPECRKTKTTGRDCVANLTSKIEGDDSMYMMDVFEEFLQRKAPGGAEESPWYAHLSIHTNHVPHPSMPEWYYAYNHTEGGPAGDYHGTISQMDAAIGRLSKMLQTYKEYDNTLLWFSAGDNGAHTAGRPSGQNSASNGLRQCKASLFEGGIRVGGFVQWPQSIKKHVSTTHAAVTNDFLPTVLELIGVRHPNPDWYSDGMSLLPLLKGDLPATAYRTKPIGFAQSGQVAWQNDTGADGVWKIIYKPQKGQCSEFLPPYGKMKNKNGPFLFNLTADPTESNDLCKTEAQRCDEMKAAMQDFVDSIEHSRMYESQCKKVGPSPGPAPGPLPPSPPPAGGFKLEVSGGKAVVGECLTIQGLDKHAVVVIGECDSGSKWSDAGGDLKNLADGSLCLKLDAMHPKDPCVSGNTIWMGKCQQTNSFKLDGAGHLVANQCPKMCAVPATRDEVFVYSSAAVALGDCSTPEAFTFTKNASATDNVFVL